MKMNLIMDFLYVRVFVIELKVLKFFVDNSREVIGFWVRC